MRKFHLQAAFSRLRALAEDFENKRRAVEHFRAPRFFEIALLYGRNICVDDDDFGFEAARFARDLLHLAAADKRGRGGARKRHDMGCDDIKPDGGGEADRLFQPRRGIAAAIHARALLRLDMDDERRAPSPVFMPIVQATSAVAGSTS